MSTRRLVFVPRQPPGTFVVFFWQRLSPESTAGIARLSSEWRGDDSSKAIPADGREREQHVRRCLTSQPRGALGQASQLGPLRSRLGALELSLGRLNQDSRSPWGKGANNSGSVTSLACDGNFSPADPISDRHHHHQRRERKYSTVSGLGPFGSDREVRQKVYVLSC